MATNFEFTINPKRHVSVYRARVLTRGKELYHVDINDGKRPYSIDIDSLTLPNQCLVEWNHRSGEILGMASDFRRTADGLDCCILPIGTAIAKKMSEAKLKISPTIHYCGSVDYFLEDGILSKVSLCFEATDDETFIEVF